MARLRIHFAPDFSQFTPYQRNLSNALGQYDKETEVIGVPLGIRSILKLLLTPFDVLHIHWPSYYYLFKSAFRSWSRAFCLDLVLRLLKLRGIRIIWTAHNIRAHDPEHARVDAWFMKRFIRLAEHVIIHCQHAYKLLQDEYGEIDPKMISVIPHGNYLDTYTQFDSPQRARSELELDEDVFVYLFLGHIRRYKGLPEMIAAFTKLEDSNSVLVVAGHVWEKSLERDLAKQVSGNAQIVFRPGFVAPEAIPMHLAAADVVVIPYQNILTSGAVVLAMSLGKPCIAPRMGCIPEALGNDGGFLFDPADPSGLFNAFKRARSERDRLPEMGRSNVNRARAWDWHDIARKTYDAYLK